MERGTIRIRVRANPNPNPNLNPNPNPNPNRAPVHGGAARDAAARVDEDAELLLPRARRRLHDEELAVGQLREKGRAELGREGEELPHGP